MDGMQWFALQCTSNMERRIKAKLTECGIYSVYAGSRVYDKQKREEGVTKIELSGCLFALLDVRSGGIDMSPIRAIRGLWGIIGLRGGLRVARLPNSWFDGNIRKGVGPDGPEDVLFLPRKIKPRIHRFVEGQAVKIVDGPFQGFSGSVEESFDDTSVVRIGNLPVRASNRDLQAVS